MGKSSLEEESDWYEPESDDNLQLEKFINDEGFYVALQRFFSWRLCVVRVSGKIANTSKYYIAELLEKKKQNKTCWLGSKIHEKKFT